MKNTITALIDSFGLGTVLITVYLNVTEIIKAFDYNKWILGLTSFVALLYLILKAQHQFIINRRLRKEK